MVLLHFLQSKRIRQYSSGSFSVVVFPQNGQVSSEVSEMGFVVVVLTFALSVLFVEHEKTKNKEMTPKEIINRCRVNLCISIEEN